MVLPGTRSRHHAAPVILESMRADTVGAESRGNDRRSPCRGERMPISPAAAGGTRFHHARYDPGRSAAGVRKLECHDASTRSTRRKGPGLLGEQGIARGARVRVRPPQISSIAGRDPKDAIDEYNAITRRRAMR